MGLRLRPPHWLLGTALPIFAGSPQGLTEITALFIVTRGLNDARTGESQRKLPSGAEVIFNKRTHASPISQKGHGHVLWQRS
jgi:hypothetical protein